MDCNFDNKSSIVGGERFSGVQGWLLLLSSIFFTAKFYIGPTPFKQAYIYEW